MILFVGLAYRVVQLIKPVDKDQLGVTISNLLEQLQQILYQAFYPKFEGQ